MVNIKEYLKLGFQCPSCGSRTLRSCYHDFQVWDSWVCEDCGLRWMEDVSKTDSLINMLKDVSLIDWNNRLIWVLHVAFEPNKPLRNCKSGDGTDYETFIEEGLKKERGEKT